MGDCRLRIAVCLEPVACEPVQRNHHLRLLTLELGAQQIAEEPVVAKGLSRSVERYDEEIRRADGDKLARRVAAAENGIADRRRQRLENRRAPEKLELPW